MDEEVEELDQEEPAEEEYDLEAEGSDINEDEL
jgi:hypothetical protein